MSLAGKTILFVGGGRESLPAIRRFAELGGRPVALDLDPNCPAARAGFPLISESTRNSSAAVRGALQFHKTTRRIDGVMSVGAEVAITVATIADALGLPGLPLSAAIRGSNKWLTKSLLADAGVRVPFGALARNLKHCLDIAAQHEGPWVIKPVDSRGSRGVFYVNDEIELAQFFPASLAESQSGAVVIESYISGPQYSSETLVVEGKPFTLGISERNYELFEQTRPSFVENGGQLSREIFEAFNFRVTHDVTKIIEALGLESGSIKGDLVAGPDGEIFWLELAVRPSGGYFCTHEIPQNTGVDFVAALCKLAVGQVPSEDELCPSRWKPIAQRYLFTGSSIPVKRLESNPKFSEDVLAVELFPEHDGVPRSSGVEKIRKVAMVICTGIDVPASVVNCERAINKISESWGIHDGLDKTFSRLSR